MEKDDVASLISGLTGGGKEPKAKCKNAAKIKSFQSEQAAKPQEKEQKAPTERVCVVVECEVLDKIRAIADKEGISLSSIYNLGLKVVLENYESLHGKVSPKSKKKGNVDEVFNI